MAKWEGHNNVMIWSICVLKDTMKEDANVGINKQLVVEPTIKNARGYRDQIEDIESLQDVNVFSPTEMLTPGTARGDDPIRTAIKETGCRCKTTQNAGKRAVCVLK